MRLLNFLEDENNVLCVFIFPSNVMHIVGLTSEAELFQTAVLMTQTLYKMLLLEHGMPLT